MEIAIITEEQKNLLIGELVEPCTYFNPVQDIDDNWVISIEEIINSIYPQNDWVKSLSITTYNPKPVINDFVLTGTT